MHNYRKIIVNRWIIHFLKFIFNVDLRIKLSFFFNLLKLFSPFSFVNNMRLYCLVSRYVNHVVFDCQVSASCIYCKIFFMINKNNLWRKFTSNFFNNCFKRLFSILSKNIYSALVLFKISLKWFNFGICICCIEFNSFKLFLSNIFDFIFL